MKSTQPKTPSEHSQKVLASLKKAVAEALERKRKLGQYAVVWDGKKPVLKGEDAPDSKD
jgi:hypothetical protein